MCVCVGAGEERRKKAVALACDCYFLFDGLVRREKGCLYIYVYIFIRELDRGSKREEQANTRK